MERRHPERRAVVGAAVVRDGRLLAARRTSPPEVAGRWELPGGKVEVGESPMQALARELAEELGVHARVTGWLDGVAPIGSSYELHVATVELVDGEPAAGEHDLVRWLRSDELDNVDWLEPDRQFLAQLKAILVATVST